MKDEPLTPVFPPTRQPPFWLRILPYGAAFGLLVGGCIVKAQHFGLDDGTVSSPIGPNTQTSP